MPGGYTLHTRVGQGGMGIVFAALDACDRPVAVKVLRSELALEVPSRGRFITEARALTRVQHPGVVRVYDVGEAWGLPFYVMEYVDGPDLYTYLDLAGPDGIPLAHAARILDQLCAAVAAIHSAGVVHLDLKPSNIIVKLEPKTQAPRRVVICDFGLARPVAPVCRLPIGELAGTPGFVAPEAARGCAVRPDPCADVYALGVLAFEVLTSDTPYGDASSAELMTPAMERPIAPPSTRRAGLGPDVDRAVLAAMDPDPRARPGVAELRAALAAAVTDAL